MMVRMPRSSMSRMVKTSIPALRIFSFSVASMSRTPTSTQFSGLTFGEKLKMLASSGGPSPKIAAVFHHVAQGFETRLQPSNANSRRTHVYASAGLAQVKRNADNTNFLGADAGEGCCGWSHEFVKPQSSQRTQSQEIHLRFCARRSSTSKHEN